MPPIASYTKTVHNTAYAGIDPRQPALSTSGKVVVITGASGGIGRATASSFAQSGPKALILLGRKADALARTAQDVTAANADTKVQTHAVDLLDAAALKETLAAVARDFGAIDILVHSAGHLPPIKPLLEVDASQFLQGFETTVTGTLSIAQAVLVTNAGKPVTFVNLTTAGVLFPPFRGMGTYVACKMAALKVLQALAGENPSMRLVNVHPGFLKTDMSANLESSGIKLPFAYDDISLPASFLVWAASSDAAFLHGKLVYAAWDVDELKARQEQIVGNPAKGQFGELIIGFSGFPRYVDGVEVGM